MTSVSISSETHTLPERQPPDLLEKGWLHGRSPRTDSVAIITRPEALAQIVAHSHSDLGVELGGTLLGSVYQHDGEVYVEVQAALPADTGDHGPIHFTFTADSWTQLQRDHAEKYPHLEIVGWFHTHPGLGVFYSGDDVVVHSAAFTLPWHVGLVIDPVRNEAAFFGWNKGQLTPLAGFYELVDLEAGATVDWRMVRTSVWQETYEEHLAMERDAAEYAPVADWRSAQWGQTEPARWGLIVGALGLILSFFLLVGWVVPLTKQVNQLETLALTLADETLLENAAACPDPQLRILSPMTGSSVRVGSELDVMGTAVHPEAYRYRIEVRPAGTDSWLLVDDQRQDTNLGVLATWDTIPHQPAAYEMRLTAVDRNNIRLTNSVDCQIQIEITP
ncbi:MAG: hypothetical protein GY803_31030 [Chloroflexi bacterium]|nr:hypothetical protein [Chloroflexota bacterium]